ncbi:hypothetical protein G6F57_017173 [Rhizopus arrhizus]|nr:hypothetical protein G6F57_017173 [Rhizopus arrhizus]
MTACAALPNSPRNASGPLVIQEQGSFAVGGRVVQKPGLYDNNKPTAEGQTFHGDHLYAFYQVPQNARPLPLVMLHGAYQSARSWETTSDGREGFQTLFLRRGYPHRGNHDRAHPLRSTVLRSIPARQMAKVLRQRAVRPQA